MTEPAAATWLVSGYSVILVACAWGFEVMARKMARKASGRPVNPWPFSEAGRFHRGIACVVAVLAIVLLSGQAVAAHALADLLVLGTVLVVVTATSAPLFRHLRRTSVIGPEHGAAPHTRTGVGRDRRALGAVGRR